MKTEIINYKGWENSIKIKNENLELILLTEVGPRIIYFGLANQHNEFVEIEKDLGKRGGEDFVFYGGHRLWHSPQIEPRNSQPDNEKINYFIEEEKIRVTQEIERKTGMQKEMELSFIENTNKVKVVHRIYNKNLWEVEFAVWPLSAMEKGGIEIIPTNKIDTECLPNKIITYWPWTKQNDKRIFYGDDHIFIKQDDSCGERLEDSIKIGTNNQEGWVAYINKGHVFIKEFPYVQDEIYPDYGVSYETFTNNFMLELETLSPLKRVKPNDYIEHTEVWEIREDVEQFIKEKNITEDYKKFKNM